MKVSNTKNSIVLVFSCTLFFLNVIIAQDDWRWQSVRWTDKNQSEWLDLFPSKKEGEKSFALRAKSVPESTVFYRTTSRSEWTEIHSHDHQNNQDYWVSELIFTDANALQLKTESATDLALFLQIAESSKKSMDIQVRSCDCNRVELRDRSIWCPDGSCPRDPTPVPNLEEFLIVHHSAGATEATDFDAVVRSYYRFHVEGNGWDDIGYNYLVSPNGLVYEGRGDFLLGAHFCGTNGNTAGICMIGNYVDRFPSEAGIRALTDLLAYKSCQIGVSPEGESFHNSSDRLLRRLSSHRDGCATACPGQVLYDFLPFLTDLVVDRIQDSCTALEAPMLQLDSIDGSQIRLSWSDPYPNESGYFLELSSGNENNFRYIEDVQANTKEAWIHFGNEWPSYCRVRASFNGIPGPYSNVVSLELTSLREIERINYDKQNACHLVDLLGRIRFTGKQEEVTKRLILHSHNGWRMYCPKDKQ